MVKQNKAVAPATKAGDDDSPIHAAPWTAKPAFMYVHHLKGEGPPYPIYLFQLEDPSRGLSAAELERAIQAIQSQRASPIPRDPNLPAEWRMLSYMVFVLEDGLQFEGAGIRFRNAVTDKNHTFFDGLITRVGNCSVLQCINYRKNQHGADLGKSFENYGWEADHSGPIIVAFHNDSGNNTGP